MDYFQILNLSREPFSNSPDPDFYFHSKQHVTCLQKIELSLRMRRGLSVIIGEVGAGKTTLCRQLIRKLAKDKKMETHLVLDPSFSTPSEFLAAVAEAFGEYERNYGLSDWQLKEIIKRYLFRQGVDEQKAVTLIVDEGQKLPDFCLEILREFLNYEANEHKLLQIVIFAQSEFERVLKERKNFADRINLYHILGPLNFKQTRAMIWFRLEKASQGQRRRPHLFSFLALWSIYRASGGYPRKIINLCHQMILVLIIRNRSKVGWPEGRYCIKKVFPERARRWGRIKVGVLACSLAASAVFALTPERGKIMRPLERGKIPPLTASVVFALTPEGGKIMRPLERAKIPSFSHVMKSRIEVRPIQIRNILPRAQSAGKTGDAPLRPARATIGALVERDAGAAGRWISEATH